MDPGRQIQKAYASSSWEPMPRCTVPGSAPPCAVASTRTPLCPFVCLFHSGSYYEGTECQSRARPGTIAWGPAGGAEPWNPRCHDCAWKHCLSQLRNKSSFVDVPIDLAFHYTKPVSIPRLLFWEARGDTFPVMSCSGTRHPSWLSYQPTT